MCKPEGPNILSASYGSVKGQKAVWRREKRKGRFPEGKRPLFDKNVVVLLAGAGGPLLFLNLDGAVAVLIGFLEQCLLLGGIFLEIRLHAEQQILVGERLGIIRLQLDRLVDRLVTGLDELDLVGLRRREVAIRLFPVVGGDCVEGLGIVRLLLGAGMQ